VCYDIFKFFTTKINIVRALDGSDLKRIYLSGAWISEEHIRKAWARVRAGVQIESAAMSVLPSSSRINSTTREVYQNNLIGILRLKRRLFTLAYETRDQGNWRKIFRGRRSIFWPDANERLQLGLTDYSEHELILEQPRNGRHMKVKVTVDYQKRRVREAVMVPMNGAAGGRSLH
jgi:hypothetical protein